MADAVNAKDYALVVGIDDYPRYRPLKGAVKDAEDFVNWLCKEPTGGCIPTGNCKPIFSAAKPLAPLQDQIDEAFDAIFSSIPKGTMARRLYLYFSGHGMAESNLITDLCLANWAEKFPNRALSAEQYLEAVLKLGKFEQIIMLLDCCRVRMVAMQGHSPDFIVPSPGKDAPKARYFLANATEFLNSSYEAATESKAQTDAPMVRGYFTRALLAALRGEAAIAPGGVPASRLKDYLEKNVPLLAKNAGYAQDPEVNNGLKGDPVFGSAPPKPVAAEATPTPKPADLTGDDGASPSRGLDSPGNRFSLTLHDSIGAKSVAVFDSRSREVFKGPVRTTKKLRLRGGAYDLLTRFAKTTVTTRLQLDKDAHVSTREMLQDVPESYTSVPLENAPTSHEYYTHSSVQWSKQTTREPLPGNADSSLFIFIRAIDREKRNSESDFGKGLLLVDAAGKEVSDLSARGTQRDTNDGWLAFHMAAPQSTLYLRFTGEPARELPLHLFAEWQTQVFLMYRGKPLFDTMKILLARRAKGFEPAAEQTKTADVALNGLQSGRDLLSDSALRLLLSGKFDNPILGLVGAHVLIQRRRALETRLSLERRSPSTIEKKQKDDDEKTIAVVLPRLNALLPGSSDVAALYLLAPFVRRSPRPNFEFDHAPMLRLGLQAVIAEAAKRPSILAKNSLISRVASRLYSDTPWSTWQPEVTKAGIDWVHLAILDLAEKASGGGSSRGKTKLPSAMKMAELLGLPLQTVSQAVKDLQDTPPTKLLRWLPREYKALIRRINPAAGRATSGTSGRLLSVSLKNVRTKPASAKSVKKSKGPVVSTGNAVGARSKAATLRAKVSD